MKVNPQEFANNLLEDLCELPAFRRLWYKGLKDEEQEELLEIMKDNFAVCAETASVDTPEEGRAIVTEQCDRLIEQIREIHHADKRHLF